ncbi:hemoglobin-3-like [Ruditapes philippinarum]|uniref:hemoglobin-3-like n=1 Tax=Ruditapes philippinarum TaxID=129788 RepID=UPI00295C3671|nr:hemoglobin-3-like [Ruditapes philippinarum]
MGDNPDTPDPGTGLTGKEVAAIRESWGKLTASWKTYGPEFYGILIEDPDVRKFFKSFNGMKMEEIRTSAKLRAHAINFKHGITSFVDNLDDLDCLVVLVHKLTANHFRREIRIEHFKEAFRLFLNFAQSKMEMDELTVNAWVKTVKVLEDVIGKHMDELDSQTNDKAT